MATKVFILSACTFLRQVLGYLFKQEDDLEVVSEAASGKEAMEKIVAFSPEVVLMVNPDGDALGVLDWIRKTYPQIKVVALSFQDNSAYVFALLRAGVLGCLIDEFTNEEVVEAVRRVASDQAYLNPTATKIMVEKVQELPDPRPVVLSGLTVREQDVLNLVIEGYKNAQVAEHLGISIKTVEAHRLSMMKKIGCKSIIELTKYAIQTGLIS